MQTWGLTDPGNIRQQNQDSYAIVPFGRDRVLMIVCDGMGGAKSGNVASSLAVEVFTDEVRRTQRPGMTPEKAAAMLRSALELSNSAVYEQSQLSDDFTGMGTTLVAVWISRDLAVVMSQLNSEPRPSLMGLSPTAMLEAADPEAAAALMDALGIEEVPYEKLDLTIGAVDRSRRERGLPPLA